MSELVPDSSGQTAKDAELIAPGVFNNQSDCALPIVCWHGIFPTPHVALNPQRSLNIGVSQRSRCTFVRINEEAQYWQESEGFTIDRLFLPVSQ